MVQSRRVRGININFILLYQSRMSLVSERKEDNREMQRSLHIIMPMAGEGSRFLKEGATPRNQRRTYYK